MVQQSALLGEVSAFLEERGMAGTTFGYRAVNDWGFLKRLRANANMTLSTVEKVREFMREERAKGPPAPRRVRSTAPTTPEPAEVRR